MEASPVDDGGPLGHATTLTALGGTSESPAEAPEVGGSGRRSLFCDVWDGNVGVNSSTAEEDDNISTTNNDEAAAGNFPPTRRGTYHSVRRPTTESSHD